MSQYMNFYMKLPDGKYTLINSYSRSTEVYKTLVCLKVPYEKTIELTYQMIDAAIDDIEKSIDYTQDRIRSDYDTMITLATWNNSVEDKLSARNQLYDTIAEDFACLEDYCAAKGVFQMLYAMMDEHEICAGIEAPPPEI